MLINANFSLRAIVTPRQYAWVRSPQVGVERVMLDRTGEEHARATSIVRYAPAAHFPRHLHPRGEEILVLSGTFSEDGMDYAEGWYLRNPPGSSHMPYSEEGAVIFVKLRQMQPLEQHFVRIDTHAAASWSGPRSREVCPLFSDAREQTCLLQLASREPVFSAPVPGAELLVLSGQIEGNNETYERGSWIRLPAGFYPDLTAGAHGTTVYLKVGHLGTTPDEI